jgi:hypothetical protein
MLCVVQDNWNRVIISMSSRRTLSDFTDNELYYDSEIEVASD